MPLSRAALNASSSDYNGQRPPAAQMAVRLYLTDVETPDFSHLWGPFLPGFGVDLGAGDGPRYLWVGFRGLDLQGNPGPELWRKLRVALDTTPPVITLIEPAGATTSQPVIQVQGTANEGLLRVTYDLANARGTRQNKRGLIREHSYDVTTHTLTEAKFQLFDVELAPGANVLTLTASDAAGNVRSQTLTVNRSSVTITIHEPTEAELAQARLTVTGTISEGGYAVWVNGVRASLTPNGAVWNWQAVAVPLGEGGTAVLQARAIPLSHQNGAGDGGGPAGSTAQRNPADSAARDTELQRDRPARLYIGSYFEHLTHIIPRGCADTRTETTEMHVRWGSEDGIRRLRTDDPQYGVTQTVQTWPAYDDQGIGIGCVPPAGNCPECVPESYHYFWALPTEYCDVADVQLNDCLRPDRYVRLARTTMLLDTGGKARPLRRNLFALSAAAYAPHDPRLKPPYTDATQRQHTMTRIEPPDQIRVLGRPLGRDGYLYTSLPDGVTVEVTPRAPGRFYYFEVSAAKHRLVLTADGHDLETTVPEFCVGERVDFKARWEPPVDAAVLQPSSGVAQWVLPAKFVNEAWQRVRWVGVWPGVYLAPYGSVNYRVEPALLRQWDTSCWYVNKPGGTVRFGAGLQFKNGQYAIVTGRGKIEIYRPSSSVTTVPPAANVNVNLYSTEYCLELGPYNESKNTYDMRFDAYVTSAYWGNAAFTQLVNRSIPWPYTSTKGSEWLDTSRFYRLGDNPNATVPVPQNHEMTIRFSDNPGASLFYAGSPFTITDSFRTFLVFRPGRGNPDENIFVTLRVISWGWSGTAVQAFHSLDWRLSDKSVRSPSDKDDDEFPVWSVVLELDPTD